jgi:hypothetical protein
VGSNPTPSARRVLLEPWPKETGFRRPRRSRTAEVFGIGLEAALAELLRSYGLAAAGLSLLCLMALAIALEVEGVDRAPMLSLILLTGWIGTTASLLVATGLFLLVGLLNIVFWIMLIGLVLSIIGWWGSR